MASQTDESSTPPLSAFDNPTPSSQSSRSINSSGRSEVDVKAASRKLIPLQDYLPLGVLVFPRYPSQPPSTHSHPAWEEYHDDVPTGHLSSALYDSVRRLWKALWIRIYHSTRTVSVDRLIWRIYLLPNDVGGSSIDRSSKLLKKSLDELLLHLDVSPQSWAGDCKDRSKIRFDKWATPEDCSLFYMFNTLTSPAPRPQAIRDRYARTTVERLVEDEDIVRGLKTPLYPYQKRSAAVMLQRESAPELSLDPRLEERRTPTGKTFFYGPRNTTFLQNPRYYDTIRGGILAETMGLGKTLICIALVLATKGFWPSAPPQYYNPTTRRKRVGSLVQMAATSAWQYALPWQNVFDRVKEEYAEEMESCIKIMNNQDPHYEIPPEVLRSSRNSSVVVPPKKILLSSGTIIVVPRNLMHQWRSELAKHMKEDALRILIAENPKVMLPPTEELAKYDVVLFSRPRFESENKNTEDLYESPLKDIHWLRIIIDEGHTFSSACSNAATLAERLIRAERRWIVSGTPAKDLLGVEVDLAAMIDDGGDRPVKDFREQILEQRKSFNSYQEDSSGAVKSLGSLATHFLKAQPWATSGSSYGAIPGDEASWIEHVYRHEDSRLRTYTSFSKCLRRTIEQLVIKTQPEDVERDMKLPPLTHEIVRLEPSFYDKMTANLYVLVFTANAVTSERTDVDYLFHPSSQRSLHRLIANLRQSAFFWTGFTEEMVNASLEITRKYLEKENTKCTPQDRKMLVEAIDAAKVALESKVWKGLTSTTEMGVFVSDWPRDSTVEAWSFDGCTRPMVMGLSQALKAQKHVDGKLSSPNPTEDLDEAGAASKLSMWEELKQEGKNATDTSPTIVNSVVPSVGVSADTMGSKRLSVSGAMKSSPKKSPGASRVKKRDADGPLSPIKAKRRFSATENDVELDPDNELAKTSIVGTSSTKFSYLLDRVMALYQHEKILIFYDGGHIAYYLSQALDLLAVKHLIYANTLSGDARSKYIVLFDTDPNHRVLLMDIRQAAHGLNLSSASRVFFVNPVCRPQIEAQAIKRAHRIGQTKPVHVETIVLKGTVEEAIYERATAMTSDDHLRAKAHLEDDLGITRVIQQAEVLPVSDHEMNGEGQMAKLKAPQQIFGRPRSKMAKVSKLETELFGVTGKQTPVKRQKRGRDREMVATGPLLFTDDGGAEPMLIDTAAPMPSTSNSHAQPSILTSATAAAASGYASIFGGG